MIDKNKQYRTRDGREVRIYATDGVGRQCVHGAARWNNGWHQLEWTKEGHYIEAPERGLLDLTEVKPRIQREVWLHIFNNGHIIVKDHPPEAEIDHRIACVKVVIDCEEGEGL